MHMRNMKTLNHLFLLITLVVTAAQAMAQHSPLTIDESDTLLLTKVCTSNQKVKIDRVFRARGFSFTPEKEIELKEGEYIIVTNLNTGIPDIIICGNDMIATKSSSIRKFILTKIVSVKGFGGFSEFLSNYTWYMVEDTLYIPTKYLLDKRHAFLLKTIPGDDWLSPIPRDTISNELVLTKDYFNKNNFRLEPGKGYQFRVEYWEGHDCKEVITDNFKLEYLPKYKREHE